MKPGFALILDQNGIVLMHRSSSGWRAIGQADPTAGDLAEQMRFLRGTAVALSGGKFATKLIIPNDQVLYKILSIPHCLAEERAANVRDALEGLTPYSVDQLAFDWRDLDAQNVSVAVVAEATLAEAELFADSHGFNPLCLRLFPKEMISRANLILAIQAPPTDC